MINTVIAILLIGALISPIVVDIADEQGFIEADGTLIEKAGESMRRVVVNNKTEFDDQLQKEREEEVTVTPTPSPTPVPEVAATTVDLSEYASYASLLEELDVCFPVSINVTDLGEHYTIYDQGDNVYVVKSEAMDNPCLFMYITSSQIYEIYDMVEDGDVSFTDKLKILLILNNIETEVNSNYEG